MNIETESTILSKESYPSIQGEEDEKVCLVFAHLGARVECL